MQRGKLLRLIGAAAVAAAIAGGLIVSGTGARVSAQAGPTVQTANAGSLGTVLTAANGKTLYIFDRDTPGTSNCNDQCTGTWPPLTLASGQPVAGPGVGGTLTLINRADGNKQVALDNRPLYFFAADAAPGDTKGDGVGGVWHAAKPAAATTTSTTAAAPQQAGAGAQGQALPATGSGGLMGHHDDRSALLLALVAIVLAALGAGALGLRVAEMHDSNR